MRYAICLAAFLAMASVCYGFVGDWDHHKNVTASAKAIANLARQKGAATASTTILSCYETALSATAFTPEMEGCIVKDILQARLDAAVFGRMSAEARRLAGVPDATDVLEKMSRRVAAMLLKYKISPEDFRPTMDLINTLGSQAYYDQWKSGQ